MVVHAYLCLVEEHDYSTLHLQAQGLQVIYSGWNSFWLGNHSKGVHSGDGKSRNGNESKSAWSEICLRL